MSEPIEPSYNPPESPDPWTPYVPNPRAPCNSRRVIHLHRRAVSWPWPERCRCDRCQREEDARIEVKEAVQVVRDLDIWGQPSFWAYRPAFHRCPCCGHRQHLVPPFKRKDTGYTYRSEQHVLRSLIGSTEEEVAR